MNFINYIQNKIDELNEVKSLLLKKNSFKTTSELVRVYSNQSLSEKNSTSGVTPNDLSDMLFKILSSIDNHINTIRKYPFIEDSLDGNVRNRFTVMKYSSSEVDALGSNLDISSLVEYLPNSEIQNGFSALEIRINIPSADDSKFKFVLNVVNARLQKKIRYEFSSSTSMIKIDRDSINPDDLFIVGAESIASISSGTFNFYGKVYVTGYFGSTTENRELLFQPKIGSQFLNGIHLEAGTMSVWTAFSVSGLSGYIVDSNNNISETSDMSLLTSSLNTNSRISSFRNGEKTINIMSLNLSIVKSTGQYNNLDIARYSMFENRSFKNKVIMMNVVGIDKIIEDALSDI